ncbi:MAG: hypothetical protein KH704_17635, partial [Clostridiales bacterium]|nr:hypothetical protein [Clostridiales bacterium]
GELCFSLYVPLLAPICQKPGSCLMHSRVSRQAEAPQGDIPCGASILPLLMIEMLFFRSPSRLPVF